MNKLYKTRRYCFKSSFRKEQPETQEKMISFLFLEFGNNSTKELKH